MNETHALDAWVDAYIEIYSEPEHDPDHPLTWAAERTILCLRRDTAEELFDFVLQVLGRGPNDYVLGNLAAGPLQDLIAYEGRFFIDRIELLARQDPRFKDLLGGVWRNCTPEAIWSRIERCRGTAR